MFVQSRILSGLAVPECPLCQIDCNNFAPQFGVELWGGAMETGVDLPEHHDYANAYRHIGRFLDEVYMHKRIHASFGCQSDHDPARNRQRGHGLSTYP